MRLHKRILLAVIAVFAVAAPSYARHILRGSAAGINSLSDVYNPPLIAADDPLPVSYDLRDYGRVTPIRNQGPWGTCWAFGAMSAVESNYLTRRLKGEITANLGDYQTVDFSELHESWFIKNNYIKSSVHLPKYQALRVDNINGGFTSMPLAYFARLDGPVLESDLPYLSYETISNDLGYPISLWRRLLRNNVSPAYDELYQRGLYYASRDVIPAADKFAYEYGMAKLRITDALYGAFSPIMGYKNRTDVPNEDKARRVIDIDSVKRLIMEHGAVSIGYRHEDDGEDAVHKSYYHVKGTPSNHIVAIIGWDDSFPRTSFSVDKRPDIDGAWLVRNNWGEYPASDKGYFWMSYSQYIKDGLAYVTEDMPANLGMHEHDPLGPCDYLGTEGQKTMWAANTFKVYSDGQSLESIAFYTTENNAVCEWQIFYDLPNKPVTGPYVAGAVSVSGAETFPYAGYHTVKLNSTIPLTKGHYFTVVVKFTNSYGDYPVAVETKIDGYSDFALVHDYETWFSDDGITWSDGTAQLVVIDNDESKQVHLPMNACIKAFYRYDKEPASFDVDQNTVMGIEVDGYPKDIAVSDLIKALRKVGSDDQANFLDGVNSSIPDEPVSERVIAIVPDNGKAIPVSFASRDLADHTPEDITFMLVNRTQEREFTPVYPASSDTRYPTGLIVPEETQYEFLFEPGYEPDVLWRTGNNFEFPVYGPFKAQAVTALVSLDVNNLVYADGRATSQGAIPKGYYDFVCITGSGTIESVSLRLSATVLQDEPESEDVTPVTPTSPDVTPVSSLGSSGGSCDTGAGFAGLAAVIFLKGIARKRR